METNMKTPLLPGSSCDASEPLPPGVGAPVIGVMGSGDFSRSLCVRLVASGFRVVVGSRNPGRVPRGLFPEGAELRSQREAADRAERLVFVAVYPEHYHTLVGLREQLAGKVLVDVSNASQLRGGAGGGAGGGGAGGGAGGAGPTQANAERLAQLFPDSRVVKGFNVVSAWALQTGAHDGNRQVLVCGDCSDSKAAVVQLTQRLGFSPVDLGGLCASRDIEEAPLLLFPSWGGAVLLTFLLFLFFYGYIFLRNVLLPYLDRGNNNFVQLPLVAVNQALAAVAVATLALVYLPGLVAAVVQLGRGTKYRRFPGILDAWLRRRKQLGLLGFLSAALHAVCSLCLSLRRSPGAQSLQVQAGAGEMVWRTDLVLSCGVLGLGVLSLVAVTSLPSVGGALNWREFTFVQSGLGYAALALSVAHVLFVGWDFAFSPGSYPYYLPPLFLLALVLPCVVLVGRLVLALPCLMFRLTKIRRGWESPRHRPRLDPEQDLRQQNGDI